MNSADGGTLCSGINGKVRHPLSLLIPPISFFYLFLSFLMMFIALFFLGYFTPEGIRAHCHHLCRYFPTLASTLFLSFSSSLFHSLLSSSSLAASFPPPHPPLRYTGSHRFDGAVGRRDAELLGG